ELETIRLKISICPDRSNSNKASSAGVEKLSSRNQELRTLVPPPPAEIRILMDVGDYLLQTRQVNSQVEHIGNHGDIDDQYSRMERADFVRESENFKRNIHCARD